MIDQQDALDHEEQFGRKVLFVHHEIVQLWDPQAIAGKDGDFYKFKFEYDLEVVEEEYPDEPYKARFVRTVRINSKGVVTAFGARNLLAELD